jgi:hypothetical protein
MRRRWSQASRPLTAYLKREIETLRRELCGQRPAALISPAMSANFLTAAGCEPE